MMRKGESFNMKSGAMFRTRRGVVAWCSRRLRNTNRRGSERGVLFRAQEGGRRGAGGGQSCLIGSRRGGCEDAATYFWHADLKLGVATVRAGGYRLLRVP